MVHNNDPWSLNKISCWEYCTVIMLRPVGVQIRTPGRKREGLMKVSPTNPTMVQPYFGHFCRYFCYSNSYYNNRKEKTEEEEEETPTRHRRRSLLIKNRRKKLTAFRYPYLVLLILFIPILVTILFKSFKLSFSSSSSLSSLYLVSPDINNSKINPTHEQHNITNTNLNDAAAPTTITMLNENHHNLNNNHIKIQSIPDPCLDSIITIDDIHSKIAEIRNIQSSRSASANAAASSSSSLSAGGRDFDVNLYERKWIPLFGDDIDNNNNNNNEEEEDSSTTPTSQNLNSFSFLQFNILAQGLSVGPDIDTPFEPQINLSSDDFYGGFTDVFPTPNIVLDFELRKWRILEVLLEDTFDIIAIEEMDRYYGFFEPLLEKFGYTGYFVPKPKSPCVSFGWYSDGCALFYKKSKFKLIYRYDTKYEVRNQIYTIATLRHLPTNIDIQIAITHLKAGKTLKNEKIRNSQVQELLDALLLQQKRQMTSNQKGISTQPIILAGDFNSDPRETNSCIQRIIGSSSSSKKDQGKGKDKDSSSSTLTASSLLKSAYKLPTNNDNDGDDDDTTIINGSKSSPLTAATYTTWKTRGDTTNKRMIDFIFHNGGGSEGDEKNDAAASTTMTNNDDHQDQQQQKQQENLFQCTHILEIPNDDIVIANNLLPGLKYPSDHLAIGAKFKFNIN